MEGELDKEFKIFMSTNLITLYSITLVLAVDAFEESI